MKNNIIIILLSFLGLYLVSCKSNNTLADAYGNFEADDIVFSSKAQGEIIYSGIEEGNRVSKGQLLMMVDTFSLYLQKEKVWAQTAVINAKRQNIEAQVQTLKEQKQVLEKEVNRVKRLLKENAATQKQLDDAEGQMKVLNSNMDAVKSNLTSINAEKLVVKKQVDILNDNINNCKVISPINGTILECYANEHELAVPGKPLFKITNLNDMHLKVFISENQLTSVKTGQKVKVLIDNTSDSLDELEGEVIWISDKAEFTPKIIQTKENRVNLVYACKVLVKNDGRIKIGMPGEIKL